jgi:hypothetical protein
MGYDQIDSKNDENGTTANRSVAAPLATMEESAISHHPSVDAGLYRLFLDYHIF